MLPLSVAEVFFLDSGSYYSVWPSWYLHTSCRALASWAMDINRSTEVDGEEQKERTHRNNRLLGDRG